MLPSLTTGTCIAQVPDGYAVMVAMDGVMFGGVPFQVQVGTHGPRDGLRANLPNLPTPGTRGLVAIPRNDPRGAVWVCSINGNFVSVNAGAPGKGGNASYSAGWSGRWHYQDEVGHEALVWPDGSAVLVGYSAIPTLTRHTVGQDQKPIIQPFQQSQRVRNAPSAFQVVLNLAAGQTVTFGTDGSISLVAHGGATATLAANGSITLHAAAGQTITASAGGTAQAVRLVDGSASTVLRAQ